MNITIPDFRPYLSRPDAPTGYHQRPEDDYHRFPAVSAGLLKEPTQAHQLNNRIAPPSSSDENEALVLGTLVHAAVLEPWKFHADHYRDYFAFCPTEGLGTKAAAAARAADPTRLLVTKTLLNQAWAIRKFGIETNPHCIEALKSPNGMKEATLIGWDPGFGCARKIRVDYLPMDGTKFGDMIDVKTTRKPIMSFPYEAVSLGYILAGAYYLDTHELLTGHRPKRYRWLVVTKEEPYMSHIFSMTNLPRESPLYKDPACKLRIAREILGLDDSTKVGRLPAFLDAARQTVAFLPTGESTMDYAGSRNLWPAYESSEDTEIF